MKTLQDREWVKIVGHRDVPGKPAMFGSTKQFLDYFNLKKLTDLPPLKEVIDLETVGEKLGEQLALTEVKIEDDSLQAENADMAESEPASDTVESEQHHAVEEEV